MISKKSLSLLLVGVMGLSVLFTGCQKAEDKEANKEASNVEVDEEKEEENNESEDAIKLADWEGIWNNMGTYLEDEELQGAFKDLAEKEDVSVEEAKSSYLKKRKADFDGLVIEEDKLIFLDGFKDKNGKEVEETEYKYKETRIVKHGNFDTEWHVFETNGEGKYKVLLMMPVHGEEALTHFHMRYGNDLEELLAMDDWYPTFVKPNSTYDQLYEEVLD